MLLHADEARAGGSQRGRALGSPIFAAWATILLTTLGVGGWSAIASLSGAVIAPGSMAADGRSKPVQSAITGAVATVAVREGQTVRAGELLVRFDEAQQRASLNIIATQLDEVTAQKARLLAERDGAQSPSFSKSLTAGSAAARAMVAEEQTLFQVRSRFHRLQKDRLMERVGQLRRELAALDRQTSARSREQATAQKEANAVAELARRRLTTLTREAGTERDLARLEAEQASLTAQRARAEGQLGEVEVQLAALDQSRISEAQKELRALQAREEELLERRAAAHEQLTRVELRAPVDGIVHGLTVLSPGAVLKPGEVAMMIVPANGDLVAELKVRPQDIDQVHVGQTARLRFPAFNQRTTPELAGTVIRVGAETERDTSTGAAHYAVAVRMAPAESERLGSLRLVPGMPVEGFVLTGERTFASWLMKPITDLMARALREE